MGDAILKCNGCTQCCRGPGRVLFLNPRQPLKHLDVNIITRYYPDSSKKYKLFVLKQKDNGDCIYITDKGCSIWDKRPEECRTYDCRRHMASSSERFRLPHIAIAAQALEKRMSIPVKSN